MIIIYNKIYALVDEVPSAIHAINHTALTSFGIDKIRTVI